MPKKFELTSPIAIIVCGVIVAAAIVFVNRYPAPAAGPTGGVQANAYPQANVPGPTETDHVYGSRTAQIFLIEYSDFQCPFCARVHPTLKTLVDESEGKVAWVYRHLPIESLHPEAHAAAVASECVAAQLGDTGFWQFADALLANNGANQRGMNAQLYAGIGNSLGINPVAFNTCVASTAYDDLIAQHMSESAAAGNIGTPFTVVYGSEQQIPVSGALPYEQFKAVISAVEERQ